MVINTNLTAINAHRAMMVSGNRGMKASEKLSSGFRINRAADDAAGLAISEKMRNQIKGLNKASTNISDGMSLINVADGAMQECHEMIGRMRELSIQASNDTNAPADRQAIQREIDQLASELRAVVNKTEFNGIKVLGGSSSSGEYAPVPSWVGISPGNGKMATGGDLSAIFPGLDNVSYGTADFGSLTASNVDQLDGTSIYQTCNTCASCGNIVFFKGTGSDSAATTVNGGLAAVLRIDITGITNGEELVDRITSTASAASTGISHDAMLLKDPDNSSRLIVYDQRNGISAQVAGGGLFGRGFADGTNEPVLQEDLMIKTGANYDKLFLQLPNMNHVANEASGVNVTTVENALTALSVLDGAAEFTSKERARMGAYHNRLEHTMGNVDTAYLNLTGAESRIRDTDMAKEMMEFTKTNILQNAGSSMMAQSFQNSNRVLDLIK